MNTGIIKLCCINWQFFKILSSKLWSGTPKTTGKDWLAHYRQKSPSKVLCKASVNIPSPSGLLHARRGNNSKYLQLKSCLNYCIWPNLKQSHVYCFHKTEKFEKLKLGADNSELPQCLPRDYPKPTFFHLKLSQFLNCPLQQPHVFPIRNKIVAIEPGDTGPL